MEAAQFLEEDGSAEALYELALIFGRETEFNDEATYYDYLFKAIDLHCIHMQANPISNLI